ncbi:BamA/TamA family outer membrane protein [Bacteroidales bacterium OttesenSCG-928-I21]|nr:BamA/TamA family outer membrane protein [Bacteroidales bacterium OttesenSCG-928-I21]
MVLLFVPAVFVSAQEKSYVINRIDINGNKKTKLEVILRELTFKQNDTIQGDKLDEHVQKSTNNLLNTSLFNFVDFDTLCDANKIEVEISVQERWYYWLYPIFEHADRNLSSYFYYRDFKKINYGLAFDWLNFAGRNDMLRFKIRLGYKEQYSISYQKKGFGSKQIFGMWTISDFFRQKKSINQISDYKPLYAENEKIYIKNYLNLGIGFTFRPQIDYHVNFGLIYQYSTYKDSSFFIDNYPNYEKFNTQYLIPRLKFEYDTRNNKIYPTKGLNFLISSGMHIGLFEKLPTYYTLNTSFEQNTPIFRNRIFHKVSLACSHFFNVQSNVLFDRKLDFFAKNTIRGYEYFYFVSPQFLSLQNTINILASKFRIHNLPKFLPDEFSKTYTRVYLNIFFDIAVSNHSNIFSDNINFRKDNIFYSAGIGINFETYYDRLVQFHVAYNSYLNKIGIFVEYKTPLYKLF